MDLGLAGKVAVVTGGASGMGACIGRMLADEGVRVVLADIQVEKGQAMAAEIRTCGGDASFVEANVSVRSQNVNTVSPGNIYTPMTADWLSQPGVKENLAAQIPIRRIGEPEDVAAVYLFLASDRARHLVGVDINVSGGQLIH